MAQQVEPVQLPDWVPQHLLGISTKMYFSHAQTTTYLEQLVSSVSQHPKDIQLFYIPSFTSLYSCAAFLQSQASTPSPLLLGGQNCSEHAHGAHTGSVSAAQLREVGCSIVELGHAERRAAPFNENDAVIIAKAKVAVEAGLIPLICVGERQRAAESASRRVGLAVDEVVAQVAPVLDVLFGMHTDRVVFAYEPVWAIGADRPADAEHVVAVIRAVKGIISEKGLYDTGGTDVRFLYGGSAGPGTWRALRDDFDGLFLGRFAHDIANVRTVVQEMLE